MVYYRKEANKANKSNSVATPGTDTPKCEDYKRKVTLRYQTRTVGLTTFTMSKRKVSTTAQPDAPPPQVSPLNINRFSYQVPRPEARALKAMIKAGGHADSVKIVRVNTLTGILTSFKNWRQVASYLDWISQPGVTRQLVPAVRISCGSIRIGSFARNQAKVLLKERASDMEPPEEEAECDSEEDDEQEIEHTFFQFYLLKGVMCDSCNINHTTATKSPIG